MGRREGGKEGVDRRKEGMYILDSLGALHTSSLSLSLSHTRLQEVIVPFQAQSLQMFNEKLCVGYQSGFSLFHVYNDEQPQCKPHPKPHPHRIDIAVTFVVMVVDSVYSL